ncbi:hypothetical protein QTP88_027453 [Uroleucon formosanum]
MESYLTDRHFQIRQGSATSNIATISAGVPQGGVLSPILFNIYAADQPSTQNTIVADYADDKVILSVHNDPIIASRNLQSHLNLLSKCNDNTNNWQTVPIKSPTTPTSPNPIIQTTNSFSSKNRFSALATNEISYEISNEVEMLSQEISNVQPKIPPIYIKADIDFFDFCKKIKPFTDPDGFNTKSSSSGLKLMTYSINAYSQIIKFLEINNMNFHTYQTNEEKAFRVTPSGLNSISNIYKINSERYENNITKLQSTNGSLWRKTKNIIKLKELIPPIKLPNNKLAISDLEKSNTFAEYFYEVFKPNNINPPINQNKINQSLNSALSTTTPPKHFTPNEIKYTISKLKNGKAPGHDLITNNILKKHTNKAILNITHIFNAMLRLSYFPPLWKISTIILVHKPGKPKNTTSSYRPISLLPSLGKLFEKLLLKRLQNISEINKIIPNSQYGFRAHHSSIHPLHRLTDAISSSLELKKYCSGVFLDVAQAFDKLEDLETPRGRKLFWNTHTKILDEKNQKKRLLEQKNRRLESKISSLNTLVDELKKECQLNASYSHILKNIGTEEEKQLLMRQLQISTGKSICPILRKFAMTLHFYSPSAYSYVRTIFSKALPDVSTIRKWYSKLDGLPGMTKESFQAISLKVKEMKVNGKQLYGCLVMDEMSIKQHVHWTGTRHQGYIDFGLGGKTEEMDNLPYAKDAFVIMVVGINTSWKVPIAYYLINGISAEEKANIILNCLQELDTTGVIIKTLTFGGSANNLSMASELEANLQYSELKPYFLHPNTNDKKLPWRLEDINGSGLHSATKLRNCHIYYFREKMKVRLAVQTFSTSVANAILFCMNDLKLDNFQGADATIEFCLSINNIFDILNTRNFLSKGTYNKSINKRTKTEIFHYIEESIDYLAGGFNALKNQQNVDHIEMLFSAIRAKGGFNNNPTVSQFEAAYKSIIVHSEIKSSSSANCMALDDTTILTVSSSNIKVKDTQSELLDLLCVAGTDDLENDNLLSVYQHSNFINDVVACIAGFVVRKIKKNNFM